LLSNLQKQPLCNKLGPHYFELKGEQKLSASKMKGFAFLPPSYPCLKLLLTIGYFSFLCHKFVRSNSTKAPFMSENSQKFEELESKIQELIASHQRLKAENDALMKGNLELVKSLEAEKTRMKWIEDGYNSLKEADKKNTDNSISLLQKRLNDIISEVDKSLSLIDTDNT